jgi:hypothetical protein
MMRGVAYYILQCISCDVDSKWLGLGKCYSIKHPCMCMPTSHEILETMNGYGLDGHR